MAPLKKRRAAKRKPLTDMLTELLESALANRRDFILCFDTDEETGRRTVHAMTGSFVSPCMLRKLTGLAESQKDEGALIIKKTVKPAPGKTRQTV